MESKPNPPSHEHQINNTPVISQTRIATISQGVASHSMSSHKQHGCNCGDGTTNADPSDRVFPIRSVVRVNQSQSTSLISAQGARESNPLPTRDSAWKGHRKPSVHIENDTHVRQTDTGFASASLTTWPRDAGGGENEQSTTAEPASAMLLSPLTDTAPDASDVARENMSLPMGGDQAGDFRDRKASSGLNEALVAVPFLHVLTEDGHAVITGRDGNLQRCEDEPIHTPGAVQSFGLLVALEEEDDGRFSVRCVSENSRNIIGVSPQELFKLATFIDIFTEEQAGNLLDHVDFIRDEGTDPATNGPDVFSISLQPTGSRAIKLWCAMHVNPVCPDLIICEFELEDDQQYPLRPPGEPGLEGPEDTLYQNPTVEELHESTNIGSKPLRVLRSARRKQGEAGAMQVFDIMSQVQDQLASAPNLEIFLKILVGIVKELTGFHRVMIYQFDTAFNGKVVTELVDPMQTRDLYYGLQFPASDVPEQARELYKLNKVRLLYDRDLQSARLVCRSVQDLEQPLDLTHAYLRAMSPIHLKYLANMAVRSSMSISINAFSDLWGLIACHGYGTGGMRVPFPIRKMCRLIGDMASRNIERLSYASRLQARKLINTAPTDKNPSGYIVASSDDLLKLFDANFGMLSIKGETKFLGKVENSQEALATIEYLRMRSFTSVITSHDIREDFPDLHYPPGFDLIAGFLHVPLSVGGRDFIVFLRKGQTKEVKWAGNPYEKVTKEGTSHYLEPRSSFRAWHETVAGKCKEWSEEQIETAAVLCLVYGKFIEVWRQKEAALQSSRLTRLLLANSAHEVRTPLNAIINYLEIAMEASLDQEMRENLARSHSASKSLIYVINDLLDLTRAEEGQGLIKDEILDLPACIQEATEPFKVDAKRKGITYEVYEHSGLPSYVHGDSRRVRQAVSNLVANAMQNTTHGSVRVEAYVSNVQDSRVKVEIAIQDTGRGMSTGQLDDLFQDLEQVSTDVDEVVSIDKVDKTSQSRTLGLGLAVVARIVWNIDGQLRLKSEEGKGSRFVIQLPFDLPTKDSLKKVGACDAARSPISSSDATAMIFPPPAESDERTVIDRGNLASVDVPAPTGMEKGGFGETNSISSHRSGTSKGSGHNNRSDADRLIDAIQTPLSLGEPDGSPACLLRPHSRERYHGSGDNAVPLQVAGIFGISKDKAIPEYSLERSNGMQQSFSGRVAMHKSRAGLHYSMETRTSTSPVKIPDEPLDQSTTPQMGQLPGSLFKIPDKSGRREEQLSVQEPGKLRVLVAEDDPINMKILEKRLGKAGHEVYHAVNGEDCASVYSEKPTGVDVILMDMQMPIVDGLTSTKIIRTFEKSNESMVVSRLATRHRRVPIFAVSASLVEKERPLYIEAGFDGWILKPIDFKRLNVLLNGISDEDIRQGCIYVPGEWERGGWFVPGST